MFCFLVCKVYLSPGIYQEVTDRSVASYQSCNLTRCYTASFCVDGIRRSKFLPNAIPETTRPAGVFYIAVNAETMVSFKRVKDRKSKLQNYMCCGMLRDLFHATTTHNTKLKTGKKRSEHINRPNSESHQPGFYRVCLWPGGVKGLIKIQ